MRRQRWAVGTASGRTARAELEGAQAAETLGSSREASGSHDDSEGDMEQDPIQLGMFLATCILVAVSAGSCAYNFFLLRSHVDPEVVVYTAHDDRRPSVLIIIIENVGA